MQDIPVKILESNGIKIKIPCIGMGTFGSDRFTPEQVADAVKGGLKTGYRLFDCAAVYGNEDMIGKVLNEAIENGEVKREELFIISKVWNNMHGKGDVLLSCAKTLKDLQLDYLDLFFVHWPFPNHHAVGVSGDARIPDARPFITDEFMACWRQMEKLVDMGLVKSIGVSNMTIPKFEAVLPLCRIKPVAHEFEIHPAFQQPELFNYCVEKNIMPIGFCPVGSPTRPERDTEPGDIAAMQMPEIIEIAKKHNVHPAIICLKWAVQRGQIPIPFSIYENEYSSNLTCMLNDPLTNEEMEIIHKADKNCRLIKGQVLIWPTASDWHVLWDENGKICGWND
ncbi:MAG: aldo/keto reductase [Oscillospiraceae bacterium]|nr:aldo/keto reductase [Oscillospiraceae bacterium]